MSSFDRFSFVFCNGATDPAEREACYAFSDDSCRFGQQAVGSDGTRRWRQANTVEARTLSEPTELLGWAVIEAMHEFGDGTKLPGDQP